MSCDTSIHDIIYSATKEGVYKTPTVSNSFDQTAKDKRKTPCPLLTTFPAKSTIAPTNTTVAACAGSSAPIASPTTTTNDGNKCEDENVFFVPFHQLAVGRHANSQEAKAWAEKEAKEQQEGKLAQAGKRKQVKRKKTEGQEAMGKKKREEEQRKSGLHRETTMRRSLSFSLTSDTNSKDNHHDKKNESALENSQSVREQSLCSNIIPSFSNKASQERFNVVAFNSKQKTTTEETQPATRKVPRSLQKIDEIEKRGGEGKTLQHFKSRNPTQPVVVLDISEVKRRISNLPLQLSSTLNPATWTANFPLRVKRQNPSQTETSGSGDSSDGSASSGRNTITATTTTAITITTTTTTTTSTSSIATTTTTTTPTSTTTPTTAIIVPATKAQKQQPRLSEIYPFPEPGKGSDHDIMMDISPEKTQQNEVKRDETTQPLAENKDSEEVAHFLHKPEITNSLRSQLTVVRDSDAST